jgi:peroxiredoxin
VRARTASSVVAIVAVILAAAACEKAPSKPEPAATAPAPAAVPPAAAEAPAQAPPAEPAAPAVAAAPTPAPPVAIAPGAEAPDFTLTSTDDETVTLSSFRGKTVVLEWFNPDCPFVVYAHTSSSLKDLAAKQTATGVVWLAINSGAPGKQGHGKARNVRAREEYTLGHPVLLDEDGKVGRLYGATRTPEFWIVDAQGKVAYAGGLDNAPLGKAGPDGAVVDYIAAALTDIAAGRAPTMASSKPYGCSVKYAD